MADSLTTVLITGCTTGSIGHALAKEFQRKGCRVIATSRNTSTMHDLVDDPAFETLALDVCDTASVRAAKQEVIRLVGEQLHILVNNAGGSDWISPAIDTDVEDVKKIYDLNLFSVMRVTNEFVPLLMHAGRHRPVHIFNIGSIAGEMANPYVSSYGSAKAALKAYGDSLNMELSPFNVTVTTVVTGQIKNSRPVDFVKPRLGPESVYKPIEGILHEVFLKGNAPEKRMPASEYAQVVVHEALKARPRIHLYAGNLSWVVWFVSHFLPLSFINWVGSKTWGFDKLKEQRSNY